MTMKQSILALTAIVALGACATRTTDPVTFSNADKDNNQMLDIREYYALLEAKAAAGGRDANELMNLSESKRNREIFDRFEDQDDNDDGFLSRDELDVE